MKLFNRPKTKGERVAEIILISLIFLNLAFIYVNSALPPDLSGESSGRVAAIIRALLPEGNPLGDFLVTNIRKLAHFFEYGSLGALVSIYLSVFSPRPRITVPVSILSGFIAAFIDETLQIFSGRGPMIADVWLDLFGYVTLTLIVCLAAAIIKSINRKKHCN